MNAIHLRKHIGEELVHALPELREMMGQDVEITVRPEGLAADDEPLETLETFLGNAAQRPPPTPEELAELYAAAETDPVLASALDFAESVRIDVGAVVRLRASSRI